MMAGIRSSNTRPEILARKALHRLGHRFRLDSQIGKIKPDIVLTRRKVAVFLHGCYFHQHEGCKLAYSDRNYSKKWREKFEANRKRDQRVNATLLENGWRVAIIWECATRNAIAFEKTMAMLDAFIQEGQETFFESDYRKI